nr:MAG TPA: intron associated endonuclease [Caudoviricetes sp.]
MIGIIYKTTCLKDGKIYIGQHRVKNEKTLDPWYIGSGSDLGKYIDEAKQLDRLNWLKFFSREILKICYTQNQLNGYEVYFIKKFDANNPSIGLNILKSCCFKKSGASRDKRVAAKISDALKGRKLPVETRLKMSNAQKGKTKGKMSDETKEKLRRVAIGRSASDETRLKLSKIRKGKKHTKSWSNKISESQRGNNCKFTNTIWIYNYKERVNKRIPINEEIPLGWNKGRMSYFD